MRETIIAVEGARRGSEVVAGDESKGLGAKVHAYTEDGFRVRRSRRACPAARSGEQGASVSGGPPRARMRRRQSRPVALPGSA